MISVVMATYNGSLYIEEQLRSILNQTLLPDEIIISDDNSTDQTVSIIERICSETNVPIYLFRNFNTLGYIKNFFCALKKAKGDIIFLADQDDIWMPEKIKYCSALMRKNMNIMALSTGFRIIHGNDDSSATINRRYPLKARRISWKQFIRHPHYPGMAMVVTKHLADKVLPVHNNISAHDWQLNQLATQEGSMYFSPAVLTLYRQHASNTVGTLASFNSDAKEHRLQTLQQMIQCLKHVHYQTDKEQRYTQTIITLYEKRAAYIENNQAWVLLAFGVFHLPDITLRGLLGDLYAVLLDEKG